VNWEDDREYVIVALNSSIITKNHIEAIVGPNAEEVVEVEDHEGVQSSDEDDGVVNTRSFSRQSLKENLGPENKLKLVEVKMLDFDWVFENGNAKKFI
jgi:uncharacterized protein YpmB